VGSFTSHFFLIFTCENFICFLHSPLDIFLVFFFSHVFPFSLVRVPLIFACQYNFKTKTGLNRDFLGIFLGLKKVI
jgi:hypothetical protein